MTKQELLDALADAAGVTTSDIKVIKVDYDTGSIRVEIDGIDLEPDDGEEDDSEDLDEDSDE